MIQQLRTTPGGQRTDPMHETSAVEAVLRLCWGAGPARQNADGLCVGWCPPTPDLVEFLCRGDDPLPLLDLAAGGDGAIISYHLIITHDLPDLPDRPVAQCPTSRTTVAAVRLLRSHVTRQNRGSCGVHRMGRTTVRSKLVSRSGGALSDAGRSSWGHRRYSSSASHLLKGERIEERPTR